MHTRPLTCSCDVGVQVYVLIFPNRSFLNPICLMCVLSNATQQLRARRGSGGAFIFIHRGYGQSRATRIRANASDIVDVLRLQ